MGVFDNLRAFFARRPAPAAMLALPPMEERAAAMKVGADVAEANALGEALARSIGGWQLPRRGSAELLAAYSTTPWLHAVCRRRAEALSAVEWRLYKPGKAGDKGSRLRGMRSAPDIRHRAISQHEREKRLVDVTDHPLLDLLENPTCGMPGPLFWELLSKWLDLIGEAPQVMTFDGANVIELTPILPTLITQVATSDRPWFTVCPQASSRSFDVDEDDMIWVREHDPLNPYTGRGVGTAAVLADELETDEYMAATAKSLFFNRGAPTHMIGILPSGTTGMPMPDEAVKRFAAEVDAKHRGPSRAGQLHFVGRDIRVASLGQTLVESQFTDGRRFLRDTCMQVFGTPPEILGVLTSSNRSTIDAADYLFAKFSTQPQLERLRAFYQAQLIPHFGEDLVLDYVSPIPDDRDFKKSVMVGLPAAFSINEVRAFAGEDPRADGDKPYPAPTGNVPTAGAPKEKPNAPADA